MTPVYAGSVTQVLGMLTAAITHGAAAALTSGRRSKS